MLINKIIIIDIMKKYIFKIFLFIITILILSSCATEAKYTAHKKQQSLMLLKNTDMHRNNKYNEKSYRRHIQQNSIKNTRRK